jgi:hypothetical protein
VMRVCLAEHNDQPSTLSQSTLRTRLRGRSCTRARTTSVIALWMGHENPDPHRARRTPT